MTENLSMRQQKIARQIQRDMADIFSKEAASFLQGTMVTVTAVRVSPDFGYAKIYVSVFPFDRSTAVPYSTSRTGCCAAVWDSASTTS